MDKIWTGLIITVVTAVIIFGGIKRIAKVAEFLVPVMAGLYILLALFVILTNLTEIPDVLGLIFNEAFSCFKEILGGAAGAAMMQGIKRGLFSNEAGMGSAPNAAATADVSHPVKQGIIQSLCVFVDTLVICSSTAFIILLSGMFKSSETDGIVLTQSALSHEIGSWATILIAVIVLLFAFSSIVGNYYYGESNIEFMNTSRTWLFVYRLAVVGMVIFGSLSDLTFVWNLADLFMCLMAIINLIAIALLGKFAFAALRHYKEQKKQGKDPVFTENSIPGLKNVECWGDSDQHNA